MQNLENFFVLYSEKGKLKREGVWEGQKDICILKNLMEEIL